MSVIDSRVVNIDELKLEHFAKGDKFESRSVRIGPPLGAKDLGYSYDVVPPGKRSCPFHSHRGEEEMFFIVKGTGTLRYGERDAEDPRRRRHLLPRRRSGNCPPDRQRLGLGPLLPVDQHDDAGGGLRIPGFEEDRRFRRRAAPHDANRRPHRLLDRRNVSESQAKPAMMLSAQALTRIDHEIAKYPSNQKRSAVMAALAIAQDEKGWLSTETMDFVAAYLDMPPIAVYEVATFYEMYNTEPIGRFKLTICTNLPCALQSASEAAEHLKRKLGIGFGETTPDRMFTLKQGECFGACGDAPVVLVNNKRMCSWMRPAELDRLLAELAAEAAQ